MNSVQICGGCENKLSEVVELEDIISRAEACLVCYAIADGDEVVQNTLDILKEAGLSNALERNQHSAQIRRAAAQKAERERTSPNSAMLKLLEDMNIAACAGMPPS